MPSLPVDRVIAYELALLGSNGMSAALAYPGNGFRPVHPDSPRCSRLFGFVRASSIVEYWCRQLLMKTIPVVVNGGVRMVRKKSRWFGAALMAMALTVTGLVVSPTAAQAASGWYARSSDDYSNGYGFATWGNSGQYSLFQVCDAGAADGRRAVGYIWWQDGGTIERHAAGGTGTCSTPLNVYIPAGKWVSMEVCERNGANGIDERCGPWVHGIAGS